MRPKRERPTKIKTVLNIPYKAEDLSRPNPKQFSTILLCRTLSMIAFSSRRLLRTSLRSAGRKSNLCVGSIAYSKSEQNSTAAAVGYGIISLIALTTAAACQSANNEDIETLQDTSAERYSSIIVGGGTAGCTVAYMTAKWMEDNHIPGKVLLVDKGVHFLSAKEGPDPRMDGWYDNWGTFGTAHPAFRKDGTPYPIAGSDHRGIGGCGTHDTRITFQPTAQTMQRYADAMGWTLERANGYYQAALNLIPVTVAIPANKPEPFYAALLEALPVNLVGVEGHHNTRITENSLALAGVAAYPNELRWTSAYLLHDSVRPRNLVVVPNAAVERVVLTRSVKGVAATGIMLRVGEGDNARSVEVKLDEHGEIALTGGAFGATAVLQRSGIGAKAVLEAAGVETVLVDNPEVGHGVDHSEIAVLYEWLERWSDPATQAPPRGGVMGWPMVAFLPFPDNHRDLFPSATEPSSKFCMAHVGAGYAEPYTDFPSVVFTPNCIRPDQRAGYHAEITSMNPADSLRVVHAEQTADWEAMAKGVLSSIKVLDHLSARGVVGKRLEPAFDPADPAQLVAWVRENHFTVFHWACTCQAGINGRVADQHFRVRDTQGAAPSVVRNLLVGSAASLPELPDANPHLTVTAFSVALAEELVTAQAQRRNMAYTQPAELRVALRNVRAAAARAKTEVMPAEGGAYAAQHRSAVLTARKPGEEYPDLSKVAAAHHLEWLKEHDDKGER